MECKSLRPVSLYSPLFYSQYYLSFENKLFLGQIPSYSLFGFKDFFVLLLSRKEHKSLDGMLKKLSS